MNSTYSWYRLNNSKSFAVIYPKHMVMNNAVLVSPRKLFRLINATSPYMLPT